jgi:hypothetical protein
MQHPFLEKPRTSILLGLASTEQGSKDIALTSFIGRLKEVQLAAVIDQVMISVL